MSIVAFVYTQPLFFGVQAGGYQVDVRCFSWLPLSVRLGRNKDFGLVLRAPGLGWHIVAGPRHKEKV